jgi:hypothetical protein
MAIATGSQIRPELSAVDYTPFLQASGQAAQMQAQGITSAVGGALKGFESIIQQQKENKQLNAEIKAAETFGNSLQKVMKDLDPEVQAQFGGMMGKLTDPSLSTLQKSAIAKSIPKALNDLIGLAQLGKTTKDKEASAYVSTMLSQNNGKLSDDDVVGITPEQINMGQKDFLEKREMDAKIRNLNTRSETAIATSNAKAFDTVVENLVNASVLGQINNKDQLSELPKTVQNRIAIGTAELSKKLGLDTKVNEKAYGIALKKHESMPLGEGRVNAILSTYFENGGEANLTFLKGIAERDGAAYQEIKIGEGITAIKVGGTTRIFDKNTVANINNMEKDRYTSVLSKTAQEYESWDKMPVELRSFIMALHQKHPPQGDALSLAQSAPEYWEKNRSDLFFGQTDQAPASAKTETERPAAPGSPASPVQARDTSRDQFLPEGGEPSSPIDQSAYKQTAPSLAPSSAKTFLGNPTYRDPNPYTNRPSNVFSKLSESMAYIAIDSLMDANAAVNWFAKTSGFTGAMMEASGIADRLSNVNYSPDNPNRREEILNAISGPETQSAPPAVSKPAPQKKTTAPSSSGKQPAKKSKAPAVNPPPGFSINP